MSPFLILALAFGFAVDTVLLACLVLLEQDGESFLAARLWPWAIWSWLLLISTPILLATGLALGLGNF